MSQPIWKFAGTIGDVNPVEYDGGFVMTDATGVYPPELEYIQSQGYDDGGDWSPRKVYRVQLERCTYVNGILSENPWHPDHAAWFADSLPRIAESFGEDIETVAGWFCSDDPMTLAMAYAEIATYHGWENFDSCPLIFTRVGELNRRLRKARYGYKRKSKVA